MQDNYRLKHTFVGVDLHKATHTAVMVNCWGDKIEEITIENRPAEFDKLLKFAKKHTPKGMTAIFGLEDVGGYGRSLAVYLLEKNQTVKEVNASLAHDRRKSNPMYSKNDSWDAQCVADVLKDKMLELPDANPQDIYWTISQLVNRRDAIVKAQTALKNQLHGQLSYNYPSYKKFFSKLDGKSALAFWEQYPSPQVLAGVSLEELAEYLRKASRNACSTKKAKAILELVKADGETTREYQETRDFLIQSHVRDVHFKVEELKLIESELEKLMSRLDYQLETMPGISTVIASQLVSEIGDVKRFLSAKKLASYAGIAPVNFSSGGKGKNQKCRLGNRTLHGIFYNLARQQIQVSKGTGAKRNDLFRDYFERKVSEGKTSGQAMVCIMRRLVNIIYGMMKNKTAYVHPIIGEPIPAKVA